MKTVSSLTSRSREILRLLHRTDGLSRSALIRESGLSGTAVFRATEELVAAGLVTIGDAIVEGRGQPSAMIHVCPDAAFSLGLSIMTDRADLVLIDLAGRMRAERQISIAGMPRDAVVDKAIDVAREAMVALGLPMNRIIGMGVAVAGFFVDDKCVNPGFELDDWALVDLPKLVGDRIGLPVMVDNIASAAAVGERLLGVGARYDSFAYVNVAAGLGAGLISGGRLQRGRNGNAGEIAGLFSLFGAETPNLASLRTMLEQHGAAFADISDLVARFDSTWPGVEEWLAAHGGSFSKLFTALRYVLDCEAIVLGGRLPRMLAQRIVDSAQWPEVSQPPRRDRAAPLPALLVAALAPEQAAPLGAASMLLARDILG